MLPPRFVELPAHDRAGPHDVCIHGAGPVGASLALGLAHAGFRVALVGASPGAGPQTRPDVRAYALNAASQAWLSQLRVWAGWPEAACTPVHDMRVHGDAGTRLDFSAWSQALGELAWIVDAAALEASLAQALNFAPSLTRVPAPVAAALHVVAEGRDSALRADLGVHWTQRDYGHHAVAARLGSDRPHHHTAWQCFGAPDVLALLPQGGPGGAGFSLVWSVPDAQAQALMALDDAAFEHELNTTVAQRLGDRAPEVIGTLRLLSPRAAWPLRWGLADPWVGEGWALVGDAAHAVHPLAGQGLNLGLADAAALVGVLQAARRDEPWRRLGDARLLRRYARERFLAVRAMQQGVDGLWSAFAAPGPVPRLLRNHAFFAAQHLPGLKRWVSAPAFGPRRG